MYDVTKLPERVGEYYTEADIQNAFQHTGVDKSLCLKEMTRLRNSWKRRSDRWVHAARSLAPGPRPFPPSLTTGPYPDLRSVIRTGAIDKEKRKAISTASGKSRVKMRVEALATVTSALERDGLTAAENE